MSVYIKNGTPLHGPSLCDTCTRAHIVKGYRASERIVVCMRTSPEMRIDFSVRECTGHIDSTRQSLYEMEQTAWLLAPRGPKRRAGFLTPSETGSQTPDEIELILSNKKK